MKVIKLRTLHAGRYICDVALIYDGEDFIEYMTPNRKSVRHRMDSWIFEKHEDFIGRVKEKYPNVEIVEEKNIQERLDTLRNLYNV